MDFEEIASFKFYHMVFYKVIYLFILLPIQGILCMYLNGTLSRRSLCSAHTFFFCLHVCLHWQS